MKTRPDDLTVAAFIIQTVCREFHLPMSALESSDRHTPIVWARWIVMHLIRKYTLIHPKVIGVLLDKDRSTVLKALGDVAHEAEANPAFRQTLFKIEALVIDALRNPAISLAA